MIFNFCTNFLIQTYTLIIKHNLHPSLLIVDSMTYNFIQKLISQNNEKAS